MEEQSFLVASKDTSSDFFKKKKNLSVCLSTVCLYVVAECDQCVLAGRD